MRILLVLAAVAALAGCGSSNDTSAPPATTTAPAVPAPTSATGGGSTLYRGGDWAVVVDHGTAVAVHLVGKTWRPDRTGKVKVELIGPHAVDAAIPQVAATLAARAPLVESALWVDGVELQEKGGGLTATSATIYGAPLLALKKGRHVAVAYARTAASGTAVARVFRVR